MRILSAVSCALLGCAAQLAAQQPEEVRIRLSEEIAVVGDLYRAAVAADSPAILLFHQGGGDARGEYADIIPRLLANGFHVLSTDVRGGGSRFGDGHRAPPLDPQSAYCSAYPDVDAAMSMARANGLHGPLILWGSSYTATLVVQAAARRSADVRAVLAFAPAGGEPLEGCQASEYVPWLGRAGIPLFITRSTEELANAEIRSRFDRLIEQGAQSFVAEGRGHGSSLLVESRFDGDVSPLWSAVLEFLRAARTPAPAVSTPTNEQAMMIASGEWNLRGDLVLPPAASAPPPLVLLLNKAAGSRTVYRELATELADRGVASLRIDLRGHGESTNQGRFIPLVPGFQMGEEHRDVARVLSAIRARSDVDTHRLAVVGASYSAEAAATAMRADRTGIRAVVALSPGDFSSDSFAALDEGTTHWLFVRGDHERFVGAWLDERVREHSRNADILVVRSGAHATDLLLADPLLASRLADWLADRLH